VSKKKVETGRVVGWVDLIAVCGRENRWVRDVIRGVLARPTKKIRQDAEMIRFVQTPSA
jgi:hypothetical protein